MNEKPSTTPLIEKIDLPKNAPKQYKLLDILLRNPKGVPISELTEKLNISVTAIYSTIGRLRKKKNTKYKIIVSAGIIVIKVNGESPTEKDIIENINNLNKSILNYKQSPLGRLNKNSNDKMSFNEMCDRSKRTQETIINLLKMYPDGVHTNEIINKTKLENQKLYNVIYSIRKKGHNIICNKGVYKLINEPNKDISDNTEKRIIKHNNNINLQFDTSLIQNEYIDAFNNLPDTDKIDCIDMLKKSLYYKKSALALIESNQIAYNFCKKLTNRGA